MHLFPHLFGESIFKKKRKKTRTETTTTTTQIHREKFTLKMINIDVLLQAAEFIEQQQQFLTSKQQQQQNYMCNESSLLSPSSSSSSSSSSSCSSSASPETCMNSVNEAPLQPLQSSIYHKKFNKRIKDQDANSSSQYKTTFNLKGILTCWAFTCKWVSLTTVNTSRTFWGSIRQAGVLIDLLIFRFYPSLACSHVLWKCWYLCGRLILAFSVLFTALMAKKENHY